MDFWSSNLRFIAGQLYAHKLTLSGCSWSLWLKLSTIIKTLCDNLWTAIEFSIIELTVTPYTELWLLKQKHLPYELLWENIWYWVYASSKSFGQPAHEQFYVNLWCFVMVYKFLSCFLLQKLQIMDPEQALKDLGITEHNVRFTSTLSVDESRIETKTAEKIYQLIKG